MKPNLILRGSGRLISRIANFNRVWSIAPVVMTEARMLSYAVETFANRDHR